MWGMESHRRGVTTGHCMGVFGRRGTNTRDDASMDRLLRLLVWRISASFSISVGGTISANRKVKSSTSKVLEHGPWVSTSPRGAELLMSWTSSSPVIGLCQCGVRNWPDSVTGSDGRHNSLGGFGRWRQSLKVNAARGLLLSAVAIFRAKAAMNERRGNDSVRSPSTVARSVTELVRSKTPARFIDDQ